MLRRPEERVDSSLRELLEAVRATVQDPTEADTVLSTATTNFSQAYDALRKQLEEKLDAAHQKPPSVTSHRPEVVTSLLSELLDRHSP